MIEEQHSLDDLRHGFGFLMHDTTRLMNRYYDRRVRNYGITRTQWTLLTYLSRYEGVSQTKLAEYMDLAPMTLTRQIDKLEKDGLLDRRQDPQDRRTNLIFLTEKSQPLMNHMHEIAGFFYDLFFLCTRQSNRHKKPFLCKQGRILFLPTVNRTLYGRGRMGGASILTRPPFGLAAGVPSGAGCAWALTGWSVAGAASAAGSRSSAAG